MTKNLLIIFSLFFSSNIFAYNYQYISDSSSIYLKFDGDSIKEIKFEFTNNNQKNFGLINYSEEEIKITLNTNQISFDEFKKFLPKPQKNENLNKKINFESFQIVREKKATYVQSPNNINLVRNFEKKPRNLLIAGDWTQYNLPCTIEASILSGKKAIETI